MKILSDKYLKHYREYLPEAFISALQDMDAIELSPHSFAFYTSLAVISSSRIEGETMELDSYVRHKMQDIEYLPKLTEKPNDLYSAYIFAQANTLNPENFLHSHTILSRHLLPEKWRGAYRQNEILVMEHNTGKVQFEAAPHRILENEMNKLWQDIAELDNAALSHDEVFYYASLIHIAFVAMHPFNDGNGRAGRLLEKWFIARHLGERAWYIKSEKYYYDHVDAYYRNLNSLGLFYAELDYSKALPFLLMLPHSIIDQA